MEERTAPPANGRRRLTRSARDRMWAGVAGGLAEYFDVDPALMRLLWVAAAIVTGGLAVLVYLALWIVMPREGQVENGAGGPHALADGESERGEARRAAGIVLVVLGLLIFAQQAGLFRVNWSLLWPLLLVAIGVALLLRRVGWRT